MQRLAICATVLLILLGTGIENRVFAQLTAEHRRELLSLNRDIRQVASLVRRKEFDEARKMLDAAEEKVEEIAQTANVETSDRALAGVLTAIEKQREVLQRAMPGGKEEKKVSFVGDVAPLIDGRCLRCHGGGEPSAGLRLDTFAGWKRGGRSGPLLSRGSANRSMLMMKLSTPDERARMPRNGEAFNREELETIATWINQGARFDGGSEDATLSDLIFEHEKKTLDVKIPKPKGTETVSFTRDIAPWMSNLCLNCHNSRRKSGGFSVETFYDIMKGGESAEVIYPGDKENSRLFRLVGGLENPRMPNNNQIRLTRQNYNDLVKWFDEGNTYDGSDPRTPIRTFVRSEADMVAERFSSMTAEEFNKYRKDRSVDQLKRTVPNDEQQIVETENFLLIGNVPEARLDEVRKWADDQLESLHKTFSGSGQPWRGRLAVFVLKDRFSYEEFNQMIDRRQRIAAELVGHSKVTANFEDAYVAVQDVGDGGDGKASLKMSVIEHVTGAYLRQTGAALPDWLVRGTGLVMAVRAEGDRQYQQEMRNVAASIAPTVPRPQDIFSDGTFSPATLGPVGYTLVEYLLNASGSAKFAQLVKELQRGRSIDEATRAAYGSDAATIARAYVASIRK